MSQTKGNRIQGQLPDGVGGHLRQARLAKGVSVREFARSLGVSASLISQIERGRAVPSVGTLYAMVSNLGISLDELFFPTSPPRAGVTEEAPIPGSEEDASAGIVMRSTKRPTLILANGVKWERLTAHHDRNVDFLCVTYDVGAESCPADALMTHAGREYGFLLEGRLGATVGFDSHELSPGDSISFDSSLPHRFWTIGDTPARVLWTVVGRLGDRRFPSDRNHA